MICFEMWNFEMMTLESGVLSINSNAAQIIILSTCTISMILPLGLNLAATKLIDRELGEKNYLMAKKFALVFQIFGLLVTICQCMIIAFLSEFIASIYTEIPRV